MQIEGCKYRFYLFDNFAHAKKDKKYALCRRIGIMFFFVLFERKTKKGKQLSVFVCPSECSSWDSNPGPHP